MSALIYSLVYLSKASVAFTQHELTSLLKKSRHYNLELNITGLLLYADGNFMQLLEGSQENVSELMERIRKDERHHDVSVLEEGLVPARHFAQWSMAFVDFASPQVRALPGYSTFLLTPFADSDVTEMGKQNVRLLHYFKSVMTASNSNMSTLSESVAEMKAPPQTNGHASELPK